MWKGRSPLLTTYLVGTEDLYHCQTPMTFDNSTPTFVICIPGDAASFAAAFLFVILHYILLSVL